MRLSTRGLTAILFLLSAGNALAAGEPWSEDFTPPPGDYSWVQLDSGEWLKGEIIALYEESLSLDSDHFGNLHIELGDIQAVHGRGVFIISFRNGRAVNGTLNIRGQQIVVASDGENLEFSRSDLLSITPTVESERDRWAGNLDFGLSVREGNTDIAEYNVSAGFTRRTPVSRISLDYLGNSNETDGVRITDSHRINLSVDRFSGRRFYWRPVSVQYYKDELQNIQHQATIDTGFGYHLVESPRLEWEIQAGAGGNYLENVSNAAGENKGTWSPVGTLSTDLSFDITSWIEYEFLLNMTFLEEAAGQYQHHMVSTLSTDLIGNLDLDVSLIWDRTEAPQSAEDGTVPEQDDYRLTIGLSYEF